MLGKLLNANSGSRLASPSPSDEAGTYGLSLSQPGEISGVLTRPSTNLFFVFAAYGSRNPPSIVRLGYFLAEALPARYNEPSSALPYSRTEP